ncbi:isochorismatase family protein [Dactylosporangium vinaceum]|uniref:Isochorismatase family protein n=1 Tax=Dactylosporangium vinaceum TaxID=53362 RepID=A0ABV5LZZ4_9ACTN|nr:isochorismatase family protein [Dactylosporangium vinaceum]UAB94341.1 isochorismatase family protein [Dactylosporangium vinaceum]
MMPPAIAYPIPAPPREGPAPWKPDPTRCALLIHDMQHYFVDRFDRTTSPGRALFENVTALREACLRQQIPIVYSAQPGRMTRADRGLLQDFWGEGMTDDPGSRGLVFPSDGAQVVTKWRYSAFFRTPLATRLRSLNRSQLLICGVFAHLGCLLSAADAYAHDIEPFLIADAVADFTAADHAMALHYAAKACAATPTTADVLAHLT